MKIKASILALAVPVALLVGCNRAESPSAENATESSTLSPAAATGATGLDTNAAGETGVNVNSPGVVTDPGVVGEGGAGATSPMTNPGNATGMGTGTTNGAPTTGTDGMPAGNGATGNGTMGTGAGAGTNSMPNNTPSGTPTPATKGNMQNAPADELGHPKRPAG